MAGKKQASEDVAAPAEEKTVEDAQEASGEAQGGDGGEDKPEEESVAQEGTEGPEDEDLDEPEPDVDDPNDEVISANEVIVRGHEYDPTEERRLAELDRWLAENPGATVVPPGLLPPDYKDAGIATPGLPPELTT